jgi:magnesium-transporting ATPase (P-type)
VLIQKVYPFKAELKRMCVVAEHVSETGARKMKALIKGAPEALEKLLK